MDKIERKYGLLYKLTKSERIAIEESWHDARRGQFATAQEVEDAFRHFRRSPKGNVSRK
jgi:hypothetical protein